VAGSSTEVGGPRRRPAGQALLGVLALVALVVLCYWPSLRAGFVWDDDKYVTANPMLAAPDGWRQIWFSTHTQSQYFPLVYSTFRVERMLWGLRPFGYHLVNVLLHALNGGLVFLLLRRLRLPGPWFAAALFALHPVQVESVAWVTELKNVESLIFYLLAVWAWLDFTEPDCRRPGLSYALALGCAVLALLAKTTACTLPVALAATAWIRGGTISRRRLAQLAPFLLAGLAMGLVSVWWEGHLGTYNEEEMPALSWAQRAAIAGRALWFYAGQLAFPADLCFSYPRWEITGSRPGEFTGLLAFSASVLIGVVFRKRLGVRVLAALIFFVASLSPLLGFIPLYTFRYSFVADHYQYTASLGLLALFAGLTAAGGRRLGWPGWGASTVLALAVAAAGTLTWRQCGVYQSSESIWRDVIAKNPASSLARFNLAMDCQEAGRWEEAIAGYRETLRVNPRHAKAANNLGLLLAQKGELGDAVAAYETALQIAPDFAMAHNNLAVALSTRGELVSAAAHLRRATELDRSSVGPWLNLAGTMAALGDTNAVAACYQRATVAAPEDPEPWRALAAWEARRGRAQTAVEACRKAATLAPERVDLALSLGNLLSAVTNYQAAAAAFRRAAALVPEAPLPHYQLSLVLSALGRAQEAAAEMETAKRLNETYPAPPIAPGR